MKYFLSLLLALFLIVGCNPAEQESAKPNIIFIMADDLGYGDIGAYGQDKIKTPSLDQMAVEGMRFTQFYSGSTVCAPSRSVLMTGLHTGHTPIRGNEEHMPIGQAPIPDSVKTIPEILKEANYATGAFGKWGLGFPGSEGSPSNQGFDYFFGYNGQRRAHFYYPEFLFKEVPGESAERVPLKGNKVHITSQPNFQHPGAGPPKERETYSQNIIMEEALNFINEQANREQPFFAYLPLNIPHASLTVPKQELLPYLDEQGNSIFKEVLFEGGHYTQQPMPRATYAVMVTLLDKYVGQVLNKLQDQDIAENTLVIFTSDNGPHSEGGNNPEFFNSNSHLRGGKRDLYEGGIRAPMIAWWPGTTKEGSTSNHIAAFEDMLPTFVELAGTQPPEQIDGLSLAPILMGKQNQKTHDYLYWEFPARGGKQAVRMGKWKAVRLDVRKNNNAPIELYNLKTDSTESKDISGQHPQIIQKMEDIMNQARIPSREFPLYE